MKDDVPGSTPAFHETDDAGHAVFQQQWQVYRTMVDHNYLFHREVFACLRQILSDEAPQPFRLIDVGCGDAIEIVRALGGLRVARYHGIDLSHPALDLARQSLTALTCPATLEHRDFVAALNEPMQPMDVIWIGLCLHHLEAPAKLDVMRVIRSLVGDHGLLVIYEPTSPDGEDRAGWMRRWDAQQPTWTAYPVADWKTFVAHVHSADYPEPESRWYELGHDAGFGSVREVFKAPTDLLRMYRFAAWANP